MGSVVLPTQCFTASLRFSALLRLPLLLRLARKQTPPSSSSPPRYHPLSLNKHFVSSRLYHKVSTCGIAASLLAFYGEAIVSEKRVVIITVCVCSVLYSMYVHLNTQVFVTLASRIKLITL